MLILIFVLEIVQGESAQLEDFNFCHFCLVFYWLENLVRGC